MTSKHESRFHATGKGRKYAKRQQNKATRRLLKKYKYWNWRELKIHSRAIIGGNEYW